MDDFVERLKKRLDAARDAGAAAHAFFDHFATELRGHVDAAVLAQQIHDGRAAMVAMLMDKLGVEPSEPEAPAELGAAPTPRRAKR